jgi:putative (di)nucleoside polyphosphate hydrolase
MNKNFSELPLRTGVGIILLNNENKVFVARRIDNAKNFGRCHKGELMKVRFFKSSL